MTNRPLVSVLTPAYNSGRYLAEAVRSALAQSYAPLEVIVVDDGSTEPLETPTDPRVRVLRQENAGPAAALNRAFGESRGDYIALLDHDDTWAAWKTERQVEMMERDPGLDLTFSWSRLCDDEGRPLGLHSQRWRGSLSLEQMMEDFVIGNTSSVVLRRRAIEKAGLFDESFRLYYDMDLFLRVAALRGGNCRAYEQEVTYYRRHSVQISADWRKMKAEWERLLAKLGPLVPEAAVIGDANMARYFAFLAYEKRAFGEALALLRGTRFSRDVRNWKLGAACLAGALLPAGVHQWLERISGVRAD